MTGTGAGNTVKMRNLNYGKNTVSSECEIWLDLRTDTVLREFSLSEGYSSAIGCIARYSAQHA